MSPSSIARDCARPSAIVPTPPTATIATARSAQPPGSAAGRAAALSKARRADLARLQVVADICPQVFLRTLGLIAQHDIVPLSIAFERRARHLRFAFEIENLSERAAAILAAKVVQLVRVRSARWISPRRS